MTTLIANTTMEQIDKSPAFSTVLKDIIDKVEQAAIKEVQQTQLSPQAIPRPFAYD